MDTDYFDFTLNGKQKDKYFGGVKSKVKLNASDILFYRNEYLTLSDYVYVRRAISA
jgi:hypothetical protein